MKIGDREHRQNGGAVELLGAVGGNAAWCVISILIKHCLFVKKLLPLADKFLVKIIPHVC